MCPVSAPSPMLAASTAVSGGGTARTRRTEPVVIASLSPEHLARWERFVHRHPQGTFFHSIVWMHSVRDAFGHEPHYLLALQAGHVIGILPMFLVRSLLAGPLLVSVPYAVGGGVVAGDDAVALALLQAAQTRAVELRVRCLELRSAQARFPDLANMDRHLGFQRRLPPRAEDVPEWLPRKARAAARNAADKHHLTCAFGAEHLPAVWHLYTRSMRRLASLCYPYRFFEELLERNRADTHVQIVRHGRRTIAGLVSFRFGEVFLPYFSGCDERYNRCGTNNYMYLMAMRRAVELGCHTFDFGRTRSANRGCADFKRFHGFEPTPLGYQYWTPPGGQSPDLTPSNPRFQLVRRVWPWLPLGLCTKLGAWGARHVPG